MDTFGTENNRWVGRRLLSPWVAIDLLGVIQADSQYVEGTGKDLQWEVEQADSQACGPQKKKTYHLTQKLVWLHFSDVQLNIKA